MSNTLGTLFKLTTFGESHGSAIGGVIDGCPAGLELTSEMIQAELDRRKPGQSKITTQRKESDTVQILSGVFEGKTLGTPIGFIIPNQDQRSKDYSHIKDVYRPSHADYTWQMKYGHRDYRGGGRSSARETASRVVGGAVAQAFLSTRNIEVIAWVERVKDLTIDNAYDHSGVSKTDVDQTIVRCPHLASAEQMISLIDETRKKGDTVGGSIRCIVRGMPAGIGEPVFDKLHAELAKALFSINAVKGVELGSGIQGTYDYGSEQNDSFASTEGEIKTTSNNSGGIQGGISNGEEISLSIAFKPVATIMQDQSTVDTAGQEAVAKGKGRHDPCVLPRAVPIVEAMTAMVIADALLRGRASRVSNR
ncbi:chorismate synthase [Sanyastnella coralliicola]|uniref:chorismate synthase n=1 Tax=Sanyastnella coralliicola TaxID=3069118 RepID=UPI0027BA132A|nr:chorismate synthase [Longitalea sp. SCSIO 12813]